MGVPLSTMSLIFINSCMLEQFWTRLHCLSQFIGRLFGLLSLSVAYKHSVLCRFIPSVLHTGCIGVLVFPSRYRNLILLPTPNVFVISMDCLFADRCYGS